jgi:hypothetical protein
MDLRRIINDEDDSVLYDLNHGVIKNRDYPKEKIWSISVRSQDLASLEGIQAYFNLKKLFIRNDKLSFIPKLPLELNALTFNNCNLSQVPDFSYLKDLRLLDLEDNAIECIDRLPNQLMYLYLKNNKLTDNSLLEGLKNLFSLYVEGNNSDFYNATLLIFTQNSSLSLKCKKRILDITLSNYYKDL